jgi:RND superfamily putative drug exporter
MQIPGSQPESSGGPADKTAALPVQGPEGDASETATEKLNASSMQDESTVDTGRRRRSGGGGLSAQDLLRREGRI